MISPNPNVKYSKETMEVKKEQGRFHFTKNLVPLNTEGFPL